MSAILLALDLGTKTGYAIRYDSGAVQFGIQDFTPRRFDGGGMRYVRFRAWLDDLHGMTNFGGITFEEVRRHEGTDAAHVYGGLLATMGAWCEERSIPYEGVAVGMVKKGFTGKGNASKEMMIQEALRRGFLVKATGSADDADALAILDHVAVMRGFGRIESAKLLQPSFP